MKEYSNERDCEHGYLRRSCPICAAEADYNALREAAVHVYNSGYLAGHLDTVEGGYVDIHSNDMDTHHKEEVAELLTFLLEEK